MVNYSANVNVAEKLAKLGYLLHKCETENITFVYVDFNTIAPPKYKFTFNYSDLKFLTAYSYPAIQGTRDTKYKFGTWLFVRRDWPNGCF